MENSFKFGTLVRTLNMDTRGERVCGEDAKYLASTMIRKTLLTFLLLLLFALTAFAQRTDEQLGGVYYAYPAPTTNTSAAIPPAYTPVYLSHYGRHGSRWLPSDSRYEWVLTQFSDKQNLTKLGRRTYKELQKVWGNARGNGGKLTSLGAKQQRGLAQRMVMRFPLLLKAGTEVEARSSVVDRCRKSMLAFGEEIKQKLPDAQVSMVTDSADMSWMSYDSPDEMLLSMETQVPLTVSTDAFMARLFKHPSKVANAERLFTELHTIASDMQNIEELRLSLFDIFTRKEMEAIYRQNCAKMWHQNGYDAANHGIPAQSAAALWQNIVTKADSALSAGTPIANLRFGHDTALYRLLSLLGIDLGSSDGINGPLDEIVPMAANLQMLFCKNNDGNVIVDLWLNEKPLSLPSLPTVVTTNGQPWYSWNEMKTHYQHFIDRQLWTERTRAINTLVGTDYAVTPSAGRYGKGSEEHGQTIPAVLEPHGQTFWTPQTRDTELKCIAPYYYPDSLLQGFRGSHWLVGGCTQDYGSFTLMPMTGNLRLKPTERSTRFNHNDELAHPYYYGVYLPDEHLMTEMTGRSHSAIFRFIPDKDGELHIAVNPNSDEGEGFVTVDTVRNCIWGYNPVHRIYQGWGEKAGFSGWFVVQLQKPIHSFGVRDTVAYVSMDVHAGEMVLAKAATSFTDLQGAWDNLQAEIPSWDFLGTRLALDSIWQRQFQTIPVESEDKAQVNQFYGALYLTSFLPRTMSDVKTSTHGARYPMFANDSLIRTLRKPVYGDFSMWDIYRAQLPLLNIIEPKQTSDMMSSLANMYFFGGWMPIFPCWNSYTAAMIGDHTGSAIADATVKGVNGFDLKLAYEGIRQNAFDSPQTMEEYRNGMGRRALKSYLQYGYIPLEDSVNEAFHTQEQVSRTLEYAYDDFCVAQVAKALGQKKDYNALMKRAKNWRNVINPNTGWADGRYKSGKWLGNNDITHRVPFITEGAVIHYSFYVPHDVYGLMSAMGGRQKFISKMDTLFGYTGDSTNYSLLPELSYYWHGNEPCHQIPYLYAYAGQPWKTQQLVHHILQTEYLDVPGGLSGNDDAGQMSAWYIFSALGFYPVCPGTAYYVLGSPSFRHAMIGQMVIEAPNASPANIYIQSVLWNGQPYSRTYITHDMLTHGGTLTILTGPKPNLTWGANKADLPPDVMGEVSKTFER